jgi:hypothetical protein
MTDPEKTQEDFCGKIQSTSKKKNLYCVPKSVEGEIFLQGSVGDPWELLGLSKPLSQLRWLFSRLMTHVLFQSM